MARQLAAIKLKSTWNTLRGQTAMMVMAIIGYLYGLVIVVALSIGLLFALSTIAPLSQELSIIAGALYTLGWILLPIIFASQDATLDPIKLAPFMAPSRRLAWALVLVSGVGVAGVYLTIFVVAYVAGWWLGHGTLIGLTAVLGALLGVFIGFVWSRVAVGFASRFQMGRRGRERAGIIAIALMLVVLAPMGLWMGLFAERFDLSMLGPLMRVLEWTPVGAPWAVASSVSDGHYLQGTAFLVLSGVTAWFGWFLWVRILPGSMTGRATKLSPESISSIEKGQTKLPGGRVTSSPAANAEIPFLRDARPMLKLGLSRPTVATAERTWLYWLRDPRLSAQLISVVVLLAVAIAMTRMTFGISIEETPEPVGASTGLGLLGLSAFLAGTTVGTLIQYDSTALWLQVSAGIRGAEDRLGRVLGSLPVIVVLLVVGAVGYGLVGGLTVSGTFTILTFMVVVFAGGLTATQVISAQWLYQVQPPGSSPLSAKQTGEFWATMIVGIGQFTFAAILTVLPGLALLLGTVIFPGGWRTPTALVFAWVYSLLIVLAGIYVSGRMLDRSQVELLTKMASWPGHRVRS